MWFLVTNIVCAIMSLHCNANLDFFVLRVYIFPPKSLIVLSSSSFFIARFSVRVAGAVAQDSAATPHGLPSPPSFR